MRRSSGRPRHPGRLHVVSPGDLEGVGLRVLSGRPLRWRHRLAGVVVVASDIDSDAGVAAVWLVRRSGSPDAWEETCLFERIENGWRYLGGGGGSGSELLRAGRPSASRRPGQRDHEHERDCVAQPCRPGSPGRPAGPGSGGVGGLRDVPGGCRSGASSGWCAADYGARAWLRHRGVEGAASVPASAQAADRGCRCGWLPAERAWPRRPPRQPCLGRH